MFVNINDVFHGKSCVTNLDSRQSCFDFQLNNLNLLGKAIQVCCAGACFNKRLPFVIRSRFMLLKKGRGSFLYMVHFIAFDIEKNIALQFIIERIH